MKNTTRDDIISMAREAGFAERRAFSGLSDLYPRLERFAALVAAHEREECIKACDGVDLVGADECIDAIRERGQA